MDFYLLGVVVAIALGRELTVQFKYFNSHAYQFGIQKIISINKECGSPCLHSDGSSPFNNLNLNIYSKDIAAISQL